jgi:hypothetical protein
MFFIDTFIVISLESFWVCARFSSLIPALRDGIIPDPAAARRLPQLLAFSHRTGA